MAVLIPGVASAAEPSILYVPTDPVTLLPTNLPPCGSAVNSALGCGGVGEATVIEPYDGAAELALAMGEALEPYDVHVTHVRPPEYVPYLMLLPRLEPSPESKSLTCTSAGINCGARQRNDIAIVHGSTMNCVDPDPLHAALYAFGRSSGLEGVDDPDDYMSYPPVWGSQPLGFVDVCLDRVWQIFDDDGGGPTELPLECTSVDHVACPDGSNGSPQQNGHQDLLSFYGARTEDSDPPVLLDVLPPDGTVLEEGGDLVMDVAIDDADPVVGVRWSISSQVLVDLGIENGTLTQCTNDVCEVNWADATPLKATDSDWSFTLVGLPAGEYVITLEAADLHGNVAELVTRVVTVGGGTGDTGPIDPTFPGEDGAFTTGDEQGDGEVGDEAGGFSSGEGNADSSSGSSSGLVLDRPGCACRSTPSSPAGGPAMLLALLGLRALRRRR